MRAIHLWGWAAVSALWMLGVLIALEPVATVQRIRAAEAGRPAAARAPDATDFYRPAPAVRDTTVAWQQRQAMDWTLERQYATLTRTGLVAILPPVLALIGLYAFSLVRPPNTRPRRLADETERIEFDQLRPLGFEEHRVIERVPIKKQPRRYGR
jgi:hypothetical protein